MRLATKIIYGERMRVLVCRNEATNHYVSAISEAMIQKLIREYDIVLNECRDSDIQEEDDMVWTQVLSVRSENLEGLKAMMESAGRNLNELPNGFEVFRLEASEIASTLHSLGAQTTEYTGSRDN